MLSHNQDSCPVLYSQFHSCLNSYTELQNSIDDIADERLDVIARMASLEERYTKQFTAMDTLVSQLQGTSDFLTNQMDAIKAAANR